MFSEPKIIAGNERFSVLLKFASLASNDDDAPSSRTLYAVFQNKSVITLSTSIGRATFPLNTDYQSSISNATLQFAPEVIYNQLIVLNFTQLPVNVNTKVTVDGVQLNSTSPTMFLQSPSLPFITVTLNMPQQVEPITFRWWLVSRQCSEKMVLKYGDPARPILSSMNVTDRQKSPSSSPVRCAMHYSTEVGYQFGVHLPSLIGSLVDPADSVYFYNGKGRVALELNNLAGMYAGNQNNLIEANTAVIIYESPYVSFQFLNTDFKTPQVKVILTQGSLQLLLLTFNLFFLKYKSLIF